MDAKFDGMRACFDALLDVGDGVNGLPTSNGFFWGVLGSDFAAGSFPPSPPAPVPAPPAAPAARAPSPPPPPPDC